MYRYDIANDSWIAIGVFPGPGRYAPFSFGLNGKGYVGTGYDGAILSDVYQYDPASDAWTQKNNFPGQRENASAGAIGNNGIAGLGYTGSVMDSDMYLYDPSADSWSAIASLPSHPRDAAASFVLNDTFYIAGGNEYLLHTDYADCWRYNAAGNTWTQMQGFGAIAHSREAPRAFAMAGHGYIFGGDSNQTSHFNDMLEFGPRDNSFITSGSFLGSDTVYTGSFSRVLSTGIATTI
jgi:N-acetylneuraminic acid mutarotase